VEFLTYKLKQSCTCERKIPEDGQQLRPKHVGALTKKIVQQFGAECHICNKAARTSLNIPSRHSSHGRRAPPAHPLTPAVKKR